MPETSAPMDDIDRSLLNRIQSDFPLTPRPFAAVARELELTEEDVLARVRRLKEIGIIRRIGGNFVPDRLGYVSTLCAARVPADKVDDFTRIVNRYPGVTHNYLRSNEFNVWFTFIAPSRTIIQRHLDRIADESGVHTILNLPATRVFKIKAHFDLDTTVPEGDADIDPEALE